MIQGLLRRLAGTSMNARIIRAASLVALISVPVKSIATFKEFAVARAFGASDVVDAYLIAFLVPSFFVSILSSSVGAAFIPTYLEVRLREGADAASRLFGRVLAFTLIGLSACAAVLLLVVPRIYASGLLHFSSSKSELTTRMFYMFAPLVIVGGVSALWSAVINANEKFAIPAITPVLQPLCGMLAVLAAAPQFGVWSLVAGTLFGAAVELVVLGTFTWRVAPFQWKFGWNDPDLRQVRMQWWPVIVGGLLSSGINFVDQTMAAAFAPGSVAQLVYASRIISVVMLVITMSISSTIVPFFSGMTARNEYAQCRRTLAFYTKLLLAITIPVTLGLIAFSHNIVHLLYERGAFTAENTQSVARIQALYALQIPFFAVSLLYVKLLAAAKETRKIMTSAVINFSMNLVMNIILSRYMGVAGIALSTSIFYFSSFVYLVVVTYRTLAERERAQVAEPMCVAVGNS